MAEVTFTIVGFVDIIRTCHPAYRATSKASLIVDPFADISYHTNQKCALITVVQPLYSYTITYWRGQIPRSSMSTLTCEEFNFALTS